MPFCNLLLDTISCFPHPYGILLFFRDYFYQLFEFCFSLIYVFCSSFSLLVLGASGLTRLRQNVPLGGAPSGRCARGPEGGPLRIPPPSGGMRNDPPPAPGWHMGGERQKQNAMRKQIHPYFEPKLTIHTNGSTYLYGIPSLALCAALSGAASPMAPWHTKEVS